MEKNIYKKPFLSIILELAINFLASRLLINKTNSVYTFFNMNNSNIFKFIRYLSYVIAAITKIWPIAKVFI